MAGLATNVSRRLNEYGTATFADTSDCQWAFGGGRVQLTVTGGGEFKVRLISLHLGHLQLLRGCEESPRIAYVSLPPSRVFVSFPTGEAPLIWDGIEILFSTAVASECTSGPPARADGVSCHYRHGSSLPAAGLWPAAR
jgi:hypothetical protein